MFTGLILDRHCSGGRLRGGHIAHGLLVCGCHCLITGLTMNRHFSGGRLKGLAPLSLAVGLGLSLASHWFRDCSGGRLRAGHLSHGLLVLGYY